VTVVEFKTATLVAAEPPTVTDVTPSRLLPVSVIAVPPEVGPEDGATEPSVGAATVAVRATRKPQKLLESVGSAIARADERN
jgi:hypothetical protein